ncbi:ABC transporter substrate-binding protein [Aneurinibacillus thermoaerophilus]|uniref:ABC transporter substrate-binding protein n=1 Tax=Aneurinibacillus thermoaerophilus TaxID=143495 RepID=A0ABX8YB04_ANETH|nr:ABC transporter substrate-binding protein [Aneurinibacillus thermoaerophilus]MED0675334.1 ABC transporter substrate-binding protein [Aneurinibacillus thermoaerophilus]MED0738285.1 ABC transporter substrate-binding protein [Aneurinibacillus thermoaerophilus]QYY42765.1 ABC transporter substrate-binding protein [Aneurinibacillus thermoaerophilus]
MRFRNTYLGIITVFICTILLLVGCGTNNHAKEAKEKSKDVTVTDAMGQQVTIPANAKRILAPYMEDSLVALGVTPVAQWSIGTTVLDYLQSYLKDVQKIGWDLPLEQTIKAKPDLIIFSSPAAIQKGNYEVYKKVAPTYVFKDEEGSDWRKQLLVMGKLLGKDKQAKNALADYDEKAKQASKKIKAAIGDETAAILWVAGDQFYLFENTRFAANVLYDDLGVAQPEMIQKLPVAEATWKPVSLEALSKLDADHLFLVSKPGESGLETLKNSSVWKGIPAVKKGNVYNMEDPSHWTISGLIANKLTIDQIVDSLTKK